MDRKKKIGLGAAWLICVAALAFFLYYGQKYLLCFREQQQMFFFDWGYVSGLLGQVGGFSVLCARFLTQLFRPLWVGPVVTALLAGGSAWFIWKSMERSGAGWEAFPLSFLAPVFVLVSLLDGQYFYQGLVAFFMACAALCLYNRVAAEKVGSRAVLGTLLVLLLFVLAGPAALLFGVSALVCDLVARRPGVAWSVISPVLALLLAWISVLCGWTATMKFSCTPAFYYELMAAKVPFIHNLSWILLPLSLLAVLLSKAVSKSGTVLKALLCVLFILIVLIPFRICYFRTLNRDMMRFSRLEVLTSRQDWNEIIRICSHDVRSLHDLNYLNLALVEKGVLAEQLFKFPQAGPESLIADEKSESAIDMLRLSHILFSMGNMAGAQSMAFNANQAFSNNPSMLKMLVQVDLMRGSYDVAGKNIRLLKKTLAYRSWAKSHEAFLGNDALVENDPVLGNGRRDIPEDGDFVLGSSFDDLRRIVRTNPDDTKARQYALAYMMLSGKDD